MLPRSTISYSAEFEKRLAAIEMGFKRRDEFEALDIEEQNEIVAIWRAKRLIAAADAHLASKRMNTQSKNGRP